MERNMKLVSDIYTKTDSFKNDEKGSIIPLTAFMLTALMLSAGAAMDYSRFSNVRTNIQTVADSAVLVAVHAVKNGESEADAKVIGQNYFLANLPTGTSLYSSFTPNIIFGTDPRKISATIGVDGNLPTTFMAVAGISTMSLSVSSGGVVTVPQDEITLVLDVSYSMRNTRINRLKVAAKQFIDAIEPFQDASGYRVVNVVPYANRVNFGSAYKRWADARLTRSIPYKGCFEFERGFASQKDNVSMPAPGRLAPYKQTMQNTRDLGPVPHCPPSGSSVLLFSSDDTKIKKKIDGLELGFGTGTDTALSWGWRTLSEKWRPSFNGAKVFPKNKTPQNRKIMVLLTDGRIFRKDFISNSRKPMRNRDAENDFVSLCNDIDADGDVILYTIGFDLDPNSEHPEQLQFLSALSGCAANGGSYYNPTTTNIGDTFRSIAEDINSIRLSS